MSDDIIQRLRTCESLTRRPLYSLAIDAWNEIERLRYENENLREQLAHRYDPPDEIERLRNRIAHLEQALDGLGYLKAINTITVELGPKASGPDDIADALRKAVGR